MKKLNTKGQSVLDNFGSLAVGVGTLAIILIIAFLIMAQGKTNAIEQISVTSYDRAAKTMEEDATTCFGECIHDELMTVSAITMNRTGKGKLLSTGNYTVANNCITMVDVDVDYSNALNVSYDCKLTSIAYNSTETLQNATQTVPGWVPIIIITAIGAAILGLVGLLKRNQ